MNKRVKELMNLFVIQPKRGYTGLPIVAYCNNSIKICRFEKLSSALFISIIREY